MVAILFLIENCTTCKKAVSFLEKNKIAYKKFSLKEKSPSLEQLTEMCKILKGDVKKLFNTSGILYRERNIKELLETLSLEEKLSLLSQEGMLVKRPFLLTQKGGLVGFKEEEWNQFFLAKK